MARKITLAAEGKEVGSAILYAVPLHSDYDYRCSPEWLLTFAQAKRIAEQLAKGKDGGRVDMYDWWESE